MSSKSERIEHDTLRPLTHQKMTSTTSPLPKPYLIIPQFSRARKHLKGSKNPAAGLGVTQSPVLFPPGLLLAQVQPVPEGKTEAHRLVPTAARALPEGTRAHKFPLTLPKQNTNSKRGGGACRGRGTGPRTDRRQLSRFRLLSKPLARIPGFLPATCQAERSVPSLAQHSLSRRGPRAPPPQSLTRPLHRASSDSAAEELSTSFNVTYSRQEYILCFLFSKRNTSKVPEGRDEPRLLL